VDKTKMFEEVERRVGTKYHLINLIGKRARSVLGENGAIVKVSEAIQKALEEISADKVRIRFESKEGKNEGKQRKPKKVEG